MDDHDPQLDACFMARAMELAGLGHGHVSPNPLVGCVIALEGRIIGEGWHRRYGEAHAEVNAIRSVQNNEQLKKSVVYVSLEPCSHHGKTPPCVDILIEHGVPKVVVSNFDSNTAVSGHGARKLSASGIEVITGMLEKEGRHLNRRFFTFVEQRRPYIILKWAQTSDGFIAPANNDSRWISDQISRQLVHRWRSEEDSVLVGTRTAMVDNPRLNVRHWSGRDPVRIVIDRSLRLSNTLHLFDQSQKTICYNILKNEDNNNLVLVRLDNRNFVREMVEDLYRKNIQSVIVEGGAQTLDLFISAGLWDEARVFVSRQAFEKGVPAPLLQGNLLREEFVSNDILRFYSPIGRTIAKSADIPTASLV